MRVLSAVDAVSPAIQRTREFLFRPFRWGTFLKLGFVAMLTEGFLHSPFSSSHGGRAGNHAPNFSSNLPLTPGMIALIAVAVIVAIVVALVVFYLVTRLRFAYFHCLTHNIRYIRPGWWLYRNQARRFFWLNVWVGFCFLLMAAGMLYPFLSGLFRLIRNTPPGAQIDVGQLLLLALPMIPIFLLLTLAGILIDIALRDWMLPHFALEDASAGEAWAQVWTRITAEKREFLVYALLRVILPTLAMFALFLVLLIPALFLAGAAVMFGFGLHAALTGATGSGTITAVVLGVFFGILAFGILVLASICLAGPVCTAIREYALLFYGGRYQALGNTLYPPPPPVDSSVPLPA